MRRFTLTEAHELDASMTNNGEKKLTFGSVCSGIEAASVAWKPLRFEAVWYSEIEPFCCAVLSHHYPETPNLGDVTKITEAQLERLGPIDILVGGTPCQSFSVAGLRKGMADPRGNLALRFLQLAGATRAPWVLWENVPGLHSSWTDQETFAPSEESCRAIRKAGLDPEDFDEVDQTADFDCFLTTLSQLGYGWAYRILDAQYFGVPQRRRRIFVVGYSGAMGRSRHAPTLQDLRRFSFVSAGILFEREVLLRNPPPSRETGEGVAHSLARGACGSHGRYDPNGEDYIVGTLPADYGKQGGNAMGEMAGGLIPFDTTQVTSPGNYSSPKPGDACHPLAEGQHPPAIAFDCKQSGEGGDVSPPLRALNHDKSHANAGGQVAVAYQCHGSNVGEMGHLRAGNQGATGGVPFVESSMAVRRFTPLECARLQGFPDDYLSQVTYRGKCPPADGPMYRALGNSMAVPVMRWIGKRIMEATRE